MKKKVKSEQAFLANMTHEFRTPINTIIGMNEMILRESGDTEINKYAKTIESAASHLLCLVNDILDYTKLKSGELEIIENKYSTDSLIKTLREMFEHVAEDKGIVLIFNVTDRVPNRLYGDILKIRQICINLLSNAIKYTDEGSVDFTLDSESKNEDITLIIQVKDTGRGIKKEDLETLFSEFHRADLENNSTIEGTGLGLAIIKQLTEQMNGSVYVDSTYHSGSVFTVALPQHQIIDKTGDITFSAPDAKILVVDDTPLNLDVISKLLKRTNMQIDTANSGYECIRKTAFTVYDIILMDDRMPRMSGKTTLRRLREQDLLLDTTKVIALTATVDDTARERYIESGFDDYLPKPVEPRILEETIMKYLPEKKYKKKIIEFNDNMDFKLPEWLLNNPYIDTNEGLKMCGSMDVYLGTLKGFSQSSRGPYRYDKDEDLLRRIHSIKSVAALIGCHEIKTLAQKIEDGEADDKVGQFFALCYEVADSLAPLRGRDVFPPTTEEMDEDALPTLYKHMKEYVQDFNDEAVGSMLNALSRYEFPPDEKERFEQLKEAHKAADWIKLQELLK